MGTFIRGNRMKALLVLVGFFLGGAWWAADKMDAAVDTSAPKRTFVDLDDASLERRLADAEKHWRQVGASVTNIDAQQMSDKERLAVHDEWKALREERDARQKTRGH